MCKTCTTMLLYRNNAHYVGAFNMKALTFTWATQITCDNAQSEVGSGAVSHPVSVVFSLTLLTLFLHYHLFILVCILLYIMKLRVRLFPGLCNSPSDIPPKGICLHLPNTS